MAKAYAGKDGLIKVADAAVGCIDKFSASVDIGTADASALGDEWDSYIATTKKWSGDASGNLNYTDVQQKALIDANGTEVSLVMDTGTQTLTGTAIVSNWKVDVDRSGKITVSFSFTGTGALTIAAKG